VLLFRHGLRQHAHGAALLGFGEFRKHRQTEATPRGVFRVRKATEAEPQVGMYLLQVKWDGIVNGVSDARLVQPPRDFFAPLDANRVLVIDRVH